MRKYFFFYRPNTLFRKGEERETNKMQLIRYLLSNFYLNMFRASLCLSSGEQECALPHMMLCTGRDGWLWLCGAGPRAVCTVKVRL